MRGALAILVAGALIAGAVVTITWLMDSPPHAATYERPAPDQTRRAAMSWHRISAKPSANLPHRLTSRVRRPRDTDDVYEARRSLLDRYDKFVAEAGLSVAQEKRVLDAIAEVRAQLDDGPAHKYTTPELDRVPRIEKSFRAKLLEGDNALSRDQLRVFDRTVGSVYALVGLTE